MSFRPRRSFAAFAAVIGLSLTGFASSAIAAPPIWEPSFGTPIAGITDADDAATTIPMESFAFPFYGVTHTGVETFGVSSNGLIQFGAGNTDNVPSGNDARTGAPKIAALWADLNPTILEAVDRGQVYMNTFNDDGDPAIDRVVFTWDSAFFGCESLPTCRALFQVQLFESGRIVFGYNGVLTNQASDDYGQPLMPVLARGGFVAPPGFLPEPPGVDFSEAIPFTGGDLIYELFFSRPDRFDLDQNNLVFNPAGAGYQVTSTAAFNRVPEAGTPATTNDKTAPKVGVKAGKQSLEKLLAKGMKLTLSCNEACFAEVSVAVKSPKVKKAGSAVAELSKAGKRSVTVGLNQAARNALAGLSKATFKVTVAVFDEAGNGKRVTKTVIAK